MRITQQHVCVCVLQEDMASVKFLVVVLVLGSGLAVDPPRPTIDATFQVSGEVEQHLPEQTVFGTFEFGADDTKKMAYQQETYDFGGKTETRMILQIPFQASGDITYYLRNTVCVNESRPTALPLDYWDWMKYASYEGKTMIRHIPYDFWGYNVGGLRLEVAVDESKNRTIKYFNRKTAEVSINYSLTFKTPPKFTNNTFQVPKLCKK